MVIFDSHLLQLAWNNDLIFYHLSNELICDNLKLFEMIIFFNLKIEEGHLSLFSLWIQSRKIANLTKSNDHVGKKLLQLFLYSLHKRLNLNSNLLTMKNKHWYCDMCKLIVTHLKLFVCVHRTINLFYTFLKFEYGTSLLLCNEWYACKVSKLWEISHLIHL